MGNKPQKPKYYIVPEASVLKLQEFLGRNLASYTYAQVTDFMIGFNRSLIDMPDEKKNREDTGGDETEKDGLSSQELASDSQERKEEE